LGPAIPLNVWTANVIDPDIGYTSTAVQLGPELMQMFSATSEIVIASILGSSNVVPKDASPIEMISDGL
jgi:hypothetical protein